MDHQASLEVMDCINLFSNLGIVHKYESSIGIKVIRINIFIGKDVHLSTSNR